MCEPCKVKIFQQQRQRLLPNLAVTYNVGYAVGDDLICSFAKQGSKLLTVTIVPGRNAIRTGTNSSRTKFTKVQCTQALFIRGPLGSVRLSLVWQNFF